MDSNGFWEESATGELVPTPLGLSICLGLSYSEILAFAITAIPGEEPPAHWRESGAARLLEYQDRTGDYSKDFTRLIEYFAVREGIRQ